MDVTVDKLKVDTELTLTLALIVFAYVEIVVIYVFIVFPINKLVNEPNDENSLNKTDQGT